MKRLAVFTLGALLAASAPVLAQTEAEFIAAFAGEWTTFEPSLSDGARCHIALQQEQIGERYVVSTTNCAGPLAGLGSWGIVDNQLALLDEAGETRIRLGGNQTRMTGNTMDDMAVIFERADTPVQAVNAEAISSGACLYVGYTASCAQAIDLSMLDENDGKPALARVLVALNARAEARPDAEIVTIVPQNTCVALDQCIEASDGRWCQAAIADSKGWIRQQAIRRNQWPTLTFSSGCER